MAVGIAVSIGVITVASLIIHGRDVLSRTSILASRAF
jgi:hypothetical protein